MWCVSISGNNNGHLQNQLDNTEFRTLHSEWHSHDRCTDELSPYMGMCTDCSTNRLYHQLGLQRKAQQRKGSHVTRRGSHVIQGGKQESGMTSSYLRNKDERAIEKVLTIVQRVLHSVPFPISQSQIAFLKTRNQDLDSANLVACGSGGWVHFWNIYGGGLVGEFTIWESGRPSCRPDEKSQRLESVTALRIDSSDASMFTGSSMGYLQVGLPYMEYLCLVVPVCACVVFFLAL